MRAALALALILTALAAANRISAEAESTDGGYEMADAQEPILVQLPVRGEWLAPNTPGSRVPSHGSNKLGTRYAYDLIQVDWEQSGWPAYRGGLLRYLAFGIPLRDYYCWGQEVRAPCDGTVVRAEDGWVERERTSLLSDLARARWAADRFDPTTDDVRSVAGNFVIIKMREDVYAALCHLQTGSVQVATGQCVRAGDVVGKVGHSGNSFGPHLHFQLMDSDDMTTARGLPCAFERYEVYRDGSWVEVRGGMPTDRERIRYEANSKEG